METDSNSDNELVPAAAQMPPYSRANIEMLIRRHQAAVTALGLAFNGPHQYCRPAANAATSVPAPKHHTIDAILGLKRDDQSKDQESGGEYARETRALKKHFTAFTVRLRRVAVGR